MQYYGYKALSGPVSIPLHSSISISTIIEEQSTIRQITSFIVLICGIPLQEVTIINKRLILCSSAGKNKYNKYNGHKLFFFLLLCFKGHFHYCYTGFLQSKNLRCDRYDV